MTTEAPENGNGIVGRLRRLNGHWKLTGGISGAAVLAAGVAWGTAQTTVDQNRQAIEKAAQHRNLIVAEMNKLDRERAVLNSKMDTVVKSLDKTNSNVEKLTGQLGTLLQEMAKERGRQEERERRQYPFPPRPQ